MGGGRIQHTPQDLPFKPRILVLEGLICEAMDSLYVVNVFGEVASRWLKFFSLGIQFRLTRALIVSNTLVLLAFLFLLAGGEDYLPSFFGPFNFDHGFENTNKIKFSKLRKFYRKALDSLTTQKCPI